MVFLVVLVFFAAGAHELLLEDAHEAAAAAISSTLAALFAFAGTLQFSTLLFGHHLSRVAASLCVVDVRYVHLVISTGLC